MEAVGIGSFWFAHRFKGNSLEEEYDTAEHLNKIKEALEAIENISNVSICGEGDTESVIYGISFESESNNYSPIYSNVVIRFNIFMPQKLQERHQCYHKNIESENFSVTVVYQNSMPVVYINYTVEGEGSDFLLYSPSSAVEFIRKYLDERFNNKPDIEFQMLGPSPFHADIFLIDPLNAGFSLKEGDFADVTDMGGGYKTFVFGFSGSGENKLNEFISKHHEMLSNYYLMIRWNNFSASLRGGLIEGTSDLLDKERADGFYSKYKYWRDCGTAITSGLRSLLKEKLNNAAANDFATKIVGGDIDRNSLFYGYLQEQILLSKDDSFVDGDIKEILLMLEGRRKSYFGNGATLFAGLMGGIMGAIFGASLSFWFNQASLSRIPTNMPAESSSIQFSRNSAFAIWRQLNENNCLSPSRTN